jgi:hypothetical protein
MINELILETLDKGKEIGKKEVLKDVLDWLDENFYNKLDMHSDYNSDEYSFDVIGLNSDFISKEQMLQSFKERFNINIEESKYE